MQRVHAAGEPPEPNLTPLLDLVLQILMFFIVTANLVAERTPAEVALPDSQFAQPLTDSGSRDPLFVNLRIKRPENTHEILIVGKKEAVNMDQPDSASAFQSEMRKQFEDLKRTHDEVLNPVVIRADRDADYAKVFEILKACADAGFRNLKVRAEIK
jgi:biopolymer transport protein ExbD